MIKLISKYKVIALIILLIVVNFLIIFGQNLLPEQDEISAQLIETIDETRDIEPISLDRDHLVLPSVIEYVPVYVCGAVNNPGVYEVELPGLIQHAIHLAGGFTADADTNVLNLASPIVGHERIYVPQKGEQVKGDLISGAVAGIADTTRKININTADQTTLESLPGIGQAKAKQIIDYRQSYGAFKSIEALQDVSGIGSKTFEGLKDLITIE